MPSIAARPCERQADFVTMQAMLSDAWATDRPLVSATPGDLEWWTAQDPELDASRDLRLWFADDEPVGWAWFNAPASIDWHARKDHRGGAVEASMLDWLEQRTAEQVAAGASVEQATTWAMATDEPSIALLESRGYRPTNETLTHWLRSLAEPIPEPPLPPGYRLRPVRLPEDVGARVAVHRAAFNPSKMTIEKYTRLGEQAHYSPDRDWVVEAPDGTFAAFANGWWDPIGRIGELEPVGTHPDHRRLGLGRAVCLAVIRRLRELGAPDVLVFSETSNQASEALYASIGARAITLHRRYALPWPASA